MQVHSFDDHSDARLQQLFLEERIPFGRIAEIIERVLGVGSRESGAGASLQDVLAADAEARRLAGEAACS